MTGVASPEEERMVRRLEATLDPDQSPTSDLLRLARLYIYPMYEEDRAIAVLDKVLDRQPDDPWARYWLAYCLKRFKMDRDSLLRAKELLGSWLDLHAHDPARGDAAGAMYQLLAEVRDEPELQDLSDVERIALLERSVHLAPGWTENRWFLGEAYLKVGRTDDAIGQLEAAEQNAIDADPAWDVLEFEFQLQVTGRVVGDTRAEQIRKALSDLRDVRR